MAAALGTPSVEQLFIIKFLVKEIVKPTEILRRLRVHYAEETRWRTSVYDWYSKFPEGRNKEASNIFTIRQQLYAMWTIVAPKSGFLGNRWIAVRDNAITFFAMMCSKRFLLHDSANLKATLTTMGWDIMNH
jgi:hypothetical protein